jgi:hypothetical protein
MSVSIIWRWTAVSAVAVLLAVSGAFAQQPDKEQETVLAERLVELQNLEAFFQAEWDFQMQQMEDAMADVPEAQMDIPEGYLEAFEQQQVEGQINDWVEAWADSFDEKRLAELVEYLERPQSQAWIAAQLEAYPRFLDALATRAEAMTDVFQEEQSARLEGESVSNSAPAVSMSDLEPVVDAELADLLEYAPGSRIEAALDRRFFSDVKVPASHPLINDLFADLNIQLVPDGQQAARVAQVSAHRAFSDIESCESARDRLEQSLAGYFPDSEETDCGHVRYLAAGGDTRMTLGCSDQKAVGAGKLRLVVSHKPTEDSAYEQFSRRFKDEETDDAPGGDDSGASMD